MAKKYGRWTIQGTLSAGGQADVFLVRDLDDSGPTRVLKRLRNKRGRLDRFRAEVEAALRLEHVNIVEHVEHDLEGASPFLVQEHCERGNLAEACGGGHRPDEALRLLLPIVRGVSHAHTAGVIHRDLKPENIFVRADGTMAVGDFGLCFIDDDGSRLTLTEEAVGSFKFLAPELADGRGAVTRQADVYALGKLLYWLCTGTVFDREKHTEPAWDLRKRDSYRWFESEYELINELLDRSITANPERRFNNGRHFLANAEHALWRLERGYQPARRNAIHTCRFCGIGRYQDLADSDDTSGANQDELDRFGLRRFTKTSWLVLWCNECGHVEYFRRDLLKRHDPWRADDEADT